MRLHLIEKNKLLKATAGFSLIELLVSMALLGIISGIGITIYMSIATTTAKAAAISRIQTQGSQAVETLERAVRSASDLVVLSPGSSGCISTASACLQLKIKSDSLEYKLSGGCYYSYYAWYAPTNDKNGRLTRYHRQQNTSISCGSSEYDLFDVNPYQGVSAELEGSAMFEVLEEAGEANGVKMSLVLREGVENYKSGTDNRASVPFVTTSNMRNY